MNDQDMIDAIYAHMQGKRMQYRTLANGKDTPWNDCAGNAPCWEFTVTEYRVKPPKKREWDAYPCGGTLCTVCARHGKTSCKGSEALIKVREIL